MWDILTYLILIILLAGAVIGAALAYRNASGGGSILEGVFGPRPPRRLDVVEHASVDGRRRLILIRRDDVEHLIMTGGPVDVVIETNIAPERHAVYEPAPAAQPRPIRRFGQAAGQDG